MNSLVCFHLLNKSRSLILDYLIVICCDCEFLLCIFNFAKVNDFIVALYNKINLCTLSFGVRNSCVTSPRANIADDSLYSKSGLDLPDMMQAYSFKG